MKRSRLSLLFMVASGLILRLALATFTEGNFDGVSYGIVAAIVERGGNVYAETARYNYSPFWFHMLHILDGMSAVFALPLVVTVRYFLSAIDVVNGVLVGKISGSRTAVALYLLSPVAILITGYHGQFDTLAALPLLLILYLHRRGNLDMRQLLLLGAAAILVKQNTVFAVWALFVLLAGNYRAVAMMGIAAAAFLLSFTPYVATGAQGIVDNVLLYDAINGTYGLSALFPVPLVKLVFWLVMLGLPFALRRLRVAPADGVLISFLAFLALSPGIGVQYFIFPALFGSLRPGRFHAAFSGVAFGVIAMYYAANYEGWNFVWVLIALWLASYFVSLRVERRNVSHVAITPPSSFAN